MAKENGDLMAAVFVITSGLDQTWLGYVL